MDSAVDFLQNVCSTSKLDNKVNIYPTNGYCDNCKYWSNGCNVYNLPLIVARSLSLSLARRIFPFFPAVDTFGGG